MKNQQIIRMRLRSSFYHVHSLKFWWVGTSTGGCEWCMVVVIPHILWWGGWKVKCSACFSLFLISYNLHIVIKNFNIKQNKKMLLYCEKALIFQPHNVWYCTYSSYGFWRRFRNINDSIGSILRDIESTEKKKSLFYNMVIFEYNPFLWRAKLPVITAIIMFEHGPFLYVMFSFIRY